MIIRESLYSWSQHSRPWFVTAEVPHKVTAGVPGVVRDRLEGCENFEQVFDIHVFRCDPLRFNEPRLVRVEITQ